MALALQDRVQETTTTAGTGTITLAGAVTGYQAFTAVGNGNTTYYCIAGLGTTEWEVGIGTYTLSGTTLARTTVLASSNGGSLVSFSVGTKSVFVTYPAEKSVNLDAAGNASALGTPVSFVGTNITGTATSFTASNVTTNANLTGGVTSVGNAATVVTNANLTGMVTSVGNAASLGSFTSAQLATALTDETGSGANVFATSPTLTTPVINGFTGDTSVINIGSGQVYKDASGNVGIGTSSPSSYFSGGQNLVISKGAASGMTIDGTTSGNASLFFAKGTTGAQQYAGWVQYNTGTDALVLGSNAAERMRIDSSGNVGIGTASPAQKLDVSGNIKVGTNQWIGNSAGASYVADDGVFGGTIFNGGGFRLYTAAVERMRIDISGNLGIGTTSPGRLLDVGGVFRVAVSATAADVTGKADNTGGVNIYGGSAFNAGSGIVTTGSANATPNIILFTRGAFVESMRIDSSGNVGIGVTPSAWNTGGAGSALQIYYASIFQAGGFDVTNFATNTYFISGTGYKYIGTAAATMYQQAAGIHRWYTSPSGTAGNAITFTQAMTLDASGNLSVGTTSSGTNGKLYVYETTFARLYLTDSTLGTAYGGQVRGWGATAAGGQVSLGAVDANVYNEGIRVTNQATTVQFYTTSGVNGTTTERMRINSSGNLGLGVTPSAWNGLFKAIQVGGLSSFGYDNSFGQTIVTNNAYGTSSGTYAYLNATSLQAARYEQKLGTHAWFTAPAGTVGNAITFTTAMTLHASGGLSIGNTTDPGATNLSVTGTGAFVGNLSVTNDAANSVEGIFTNTNTGVTASAGVRGIGNSTGYWLLRQYGTGVTATVFGTALANYALLASDGASSNGLMVGSLTSDPVIFGTNNTERMRIHSSGGLSLGNTTDPGATNLSVTGTGTFGTTVGVGAATPSTSGAGITFPATQSASIGANTLDDYEEGTWTIGISFGGASVGITASATAGTYTKIGNVVTVRGYYIMTNKGSSTGAAKITGLPFTAAAPASAYSGVAFGLIQNITFSGQLFSYVNLGATTCDLRNTTLLGVDSAVTDVNFANNSTFIMELTYSV